MQILWGQKIKKIYTYDIPTIYYRFMESIELLDTSNELLIKTTISKLRIILDEFCDLVDEEKLKGIFKEMNILNFDELLSKNSIEIKNILVSSKLFEEEISNKLINPNKWVRLRQSNDKIELTVKHVYEKSYGSIQKVKECEIKVSDLDETNKLLEEMGIVRRNYQEKTRHSFKYKDAEIELDEWPSLEPYMEIECEDQSIIDEVIKKLNFEVKEIVSLNTQQLYKRKNIDVLKISDLKF